MANESRIQKLNELVFCQLPRALQDALAVKVSRDPFGLRVVAEFRQKDGPMRWQAHLEPLPGSPLGPKLIIPDALLAQMCVECPNKAPPDTRDTITGGNII